MKGTTPADPTPSRPLDTPSQHGLLRGRRLSAPSGEDAVRLTLLGLVIALQNALEFPRDAISRALGKQLTGLLVFMVLATSLALLMFAARERLPRWRWLQSRRVQVGVLLVTLAACPAGLHQVGASLASGFQPPMYPNDGTLLDHYAAQQLLEGHNPYVTVDIVSALHLYHQDAEHTTPLRRGAFATLPLTDYPDKALVRHIFASEPIGQPNRVLEFESHVSYPALAFLPLVPFVWVGAPSVVPFFTLCFFVLAALLILSAPTQLRPWVGLLVLADTPLLNATVAGDLDVFYILLLFVAWRWWRRPVLSSGFLGLALAAKQISWFFLPFYALLVWRERGWRDATVRLLAAAGLFALINGPFILNNPQAWAAGVLAPEVDPMFPLGNGLIHLSLAGLVPLAPSWFYTALEGLAALACVAWYWHYGRKDPALGFVLAVVPLFFAWRSLTTYFYFVALPAVALLLAWRHDNQKRGEISGMPIVGTPGHTPQAEIVS